MKNLFNILFSICIGIVIGVILCVLFPKPQPEPQIITKVVETTPGITPDIRIVSKTKLTGHAKITPIPTTLPVNQDGNQPGINQTQNGAILALKIDSEIKAQLVGEQKINYYNSGGDLIGSSIHPLTAELTTRVLPDGLDFSLEYPDELNLTVETKPPETHNTIELGFNGRFFVNYTYDNSGYFIKLGYIFGDKYPNGAVGLIKRF